MGCWSVSEIDNKMQAPTWFCSNSFLKFKVWIFMVSLAVEGICLGCSALMWLQATCGLSNPSLLARLSTILRNIDMATCVGHEHDTIWTPKHKICAPKKDNRNSNYTTKMLRLLQSNCTTITQQNCQHSKGDASVALKDARGGREYCITIYIDYNGWCRSRKQ